MWEARNARCAQRPGAAPLTITHQKAGHSLFPGFSTPRPPAIHQTTKAFLTQVLLGWILPDHSLSKGGLVALQLYLLCPTQGSASVIGSVNAYYADNLSLIFLVSSNLSGTVLLCHKLTETAPRS